MAAEFTVSGDWGKTERFLKRIGSGDIYKGLDSLAKQGVEALRSATPVDSGITAQSWGYEIQHDRRGVTIVWTNSSVEAGYPIVVMLQYGHATGTGGYVKGKDFINPAIKPIFDRISDEVWKAVTTDG